MKKTLQILSLIAITAISNDFRSQTAGSLTFSFTPVAPAVGTTYSGTRNALAVWIESSTGAFIKTKLRYAGPGNGTSDHLPTWAVKSGGTAANCVAAACNIVDATTGATLANYAAKTVIWDGKNVTAAVNGTIVPDGVYKVWIEESWNHGATGTIVTSFTFTKGAAADVQTPADQARFTGISLNWSPAPVGLETVETSNVSIFPNPSAGIFHINYLKATNVSIVDASGKVIDQIAVDTTNAQGMSVDLSALNAGTYFISVFDGISYSSHEVVLTK
jgi:hypothetical protein